MSRSGYSDDGDNYAMWRGQVASAIRGKRGQKLLHELAEAMDAMPEKVLIANDLQKGRAYCALGVVGAKRGLDMTVLDPEDPDQLSRAFDVAAQLAQEIEYINDECGEDYRPVNGRWEYVGETPEQRWTRVRKWVGEQLLPPSAANSEREGK